MTMFGDTLAANLCRGKAEQGEHKAKDGSALLEGSSGGGAHTGLVRSAAGGTWCNGGGDK